MSVHYQAVGWNRQKKIYDAVLAAGVLLYLAAFVGGGAVLYPEATAETLLIRGLGTLALLMLHVILAIGPASRLDRRFLPLLYNRRHFGVTMFVIALAHGAFSIFQFHALGDTPVLDSLFTANPRYAGLADFPFEIAGFFALVILFFLAATSHDFWLNLLTPAVWKRLHMGVYAAYALLVAHVALGALQQDRSFGPPLLLGAGMIVLLALHLAAAGREARADREAPLRDGFVAVGPAAEIPDSRARVVTAGGERIAVFKYGNCVSAISNVCRHQNGPLGEGKIVDGCVTCPWHGYQYLPDSGASPPPFTEKVETYQTRIVDGIVYVDPKPHPPGTKLAPSRLA